MSAEGRITWAMPIWMQTMNEESKTTTTTDGRNDHCCSKEHTMGTAPLESNTGSLEDRTQVSQKDPMPELPTVASTRMEAMDLADQWQAWLEDRPQRKVRKR